MWAEDDGVSCFQADQALEDGCAGWVCGRDDAANDSYGFRDFLDPKCVVLLDRKSVV